MTTPTNIEDMTYEQAHNEIRSNYYAITDGLIALKEIARVKEDTYLEILCDEIDKDLTKHLNKEHSNWD